IERAERREEREVAERPEQWRQLREICSAVSVLIRGRIDGAAGVAAENGESRPSFLLGERGDLLRRGLEVDVRLRVLCRRALHPALGAGEEGEAHRVGEGRRLDYAVSERGRSQRRVCVESPDRRRLPADRPGREDRGRPLTGGGDRAGVAANRPRVRAVWAGRHGENRVGLVDAVAWKTGSAR